MGMFDYVNFEMKCPKCGGLVTEFQSKDAGCDLDKIEPDSVSNFYAPCDCGAWIEFYKPRVNRPLRENKLSLDDIHGLGYEMKVTDGCYGPIMTQGD